MFCYTFFKATAIAPRAGASGGLRSECGILGAGKIGQAIADASRPAGHQVIVSNSRGPASLGRPGRDARSQCAGGRPRDAAAAPVVFLTLVWTRPVRGAARPGRRGTAASSSTPPTARGRGRRLPAVDLGGRTSSEVVAAQLPGARLVKAFNTLPAALLATDPHDAGGRRVVFVSGDDPAARKEIAGLTRSMGFAAVDLGRLSAGGVVQGAGGALAGANFVKLG